MPKPAEQDLLPPGTPERLRKEFSFYDRGSVRHLTRYQRFKAIQIIAGAAIPIAAVMVPDTNWLRGITATLGGLVAGIESYVQFRQYQQNWIRWRTAAEGLKREAYLFSQKAGPYRGATDGEVILAERVEEIIEGEQQSWKSRQENLHPAVAGSETNNP